MLSDCTYQESYGLFVLIANYGDGIQFGKGKGTIELAKNFGMSHTDLNALLKRLVSHDLIERDFGYWGKQGGRTEYRYKLTKKLLNEVDESKCLFLGKISTGRFRSLYQEYCSYVRKHAEALSGERLIVRWIMINLMALVKTGVWGDSATFSTLKSVLNGRVTSTRISSALKKLEALKVIYQPDTKDMLETDKTMFYVGSWNDALKASRDNVKVTGAKFHPNNMDSLGITNSPNFRVFFPYPAVNVKPSTHTLGSSILISWICNDTFLFDSKEPEGSFLLGMKEHYRKRDWAALMGIQNNAIASIILSEYSELLRQSDVLFEKSSSTSKDQQEMVKSVYEKLLGNTNIKQHLELNQWLPKSLLALVNIRRLEDIPFDWHSLTKEEQINLSRNTPVSFVRAYILYSLYHSFCLARMVYQWLHTTNNYSPTRFSYHIGFHFWAYPRSLNSEKNNPNEEVLDNSASNDFNVCASVYAESRSKDIWDKDELHVFSHKKLEFYHSKSRLF
ncbi:hypothetical protein [Vibrio ziniensis]|uniref:Uncharacterized protein n=1 Tax=Vibrio ziniensis TaxID=2711221 RepID=A0A6G7CG52_9VIBR|nr:hypothetical protein [Vibrio ziniensis]QIH41095.1 hypothetical protein G5S32_03435 [Vibrio ziniensis]